MTTAPFLVDSHCHLDFADFVAFHIEVCEVEVAVTVDQKRRGGHAGCGSGWT